jgi:hypothetical protein
MLYTYFFIVLKISLPVCFLLVVCPGIKPIWINLALLVRLEYSFA